MAQDRMKINGIAVKQPDEGLGYDFETTYTEDSTRVQSGVLHISPMFTVEAFSYSASNLNLNEMSTILQQIAKGQKFTLHYLSPFYGDWRDAEFYVGKGSINIGRWKKDKECYDSLSFNMIGVNPV